MMNNGQLIFNANPIVVALQKPAAEFTKADIIDYIVSNQIRMVNFMYPGGDGRLKTLNFVINGYHPYLWRACRWLKPVFFHSGRLKRSLCAAPFPYGFRRPVC